MNLLALLIILWLRVQFSIFKFGIIGTFYKIFDAHRLNVKKPRAVPK